MIQCFSLGLLTSRINMSALSIFQWIIPVNLKQTMYQLNSQSSFLFWIFFVNFIRFAYVSYKHGRYKPILATDSDQYASDFRPAQQSDLGYWLNLLCKLGFKIYIRNSTLIQISLRLLLDSNDSGDILSCIMWPCLMWINYIWRLLIHNRPFTCDLAS